MRKPSAKDQLTPKEEELMQLLWANAPLLLSKIVELYPEPRPHANTVATVIRRLEAKGFVSHNVVSGDFEYYAVARMEDFRRRSLGQLIKSYFSGSYFGAVSALVNDDCLSEEELHELMEMVEQKRRERDNNPNNSNNSNNNG